MKINRLTIIFLSIFSILQAQDCPSVAISNAVSEPNENACVEFSLADMEVAGIQGTFVYDTTILKFNTLAILHEEFQNSLNGEDFYNTVQKKVVFSLLSDSTKSVVINKEFEPILNICFSIIGENESSSEVAFTSDLLAIEFSNENGKFDLCSNAAGSISINGEAIVDSLEVSVVVENKNCGDAAGNFITPTVQGGLAPYTYNWSGSASYSSTEEVISGMEAGYYNLTVTDVLGTQSFTNAIEVGFASEFNTIQLITDTSCGNTATGSIDYLVFTDDFGSFTFEWSNGATTNNISNLTAGQYTVTVTDDHQCTLTETFTVIEGMTGTFLDSIALIRNVECGNATGSLQAELFPSEMGTFTYEWSNGMTTQTINNLEEGNYGLTVTNENGCTSSKDFELKSVNLLSSPVLTTTCASDNIDNGSINVTGISDIINYETVWSNNIFNQDLNENLAPATYSVTITSGGCQKVLEATVEESLATYQSSYTLCRQDSLEIITSSNNSTLHYRWLPSDRFTSDSTEMTTYLTSLIDTTFQTFSLRTFGELGCTKTFDFTLDMDDECVWPGDTDLDNAVTAADLLYIGLANGQSGPARPNASSDWTAQPSIFWNAPIGNTNVDVMHADCNGDGMVDSSDILVVQQNNGLAHSGFTPQESITRVVSVPIFVDLKSSYNDNESADINIILGTEDNQVTDAYGIAFQLMYNPEANSLDANKFLAEGWLSDDGTSVWSVDFVDNKNGTADIAITRNDGNNISGFGKIASINSTFHITDNDGNSDFEIAVVNPILINSAGNKAEIEGMTTSANTSTVRVTYSNGKDFNENIYPNPASSFLHIQSDRKITNCIIYNVLGEVIRTHKASATIDISNLVQGAYYLTLNGVDGLTRHPFIKQ